MTGTEAGRLNLSGHWHGDGGDLWAFDADLDVQGAAVDGRIKWTLVACPPNLAWAKKVGKSGYEDVRGTLDGRRLTLQGYCVDDANLIAAGDHTIRLPAEDGEFQGTSKAGAEGGRYIGRVKFQ